MKSIKLELIKLLIFKEHLIEIEKMQSINLRHMKQFELIVKIKTVI